MSIVIAILMFGLVILVHEWGHFIAARRCGILVEEFAMGMGPKIFGVQRGETLFSIRAFPIGGFCKMYGDEASAGEGETSEVEEHLKDRSLNSKPIWQRVSVMVAGSVMNFLLAFIIFSLLAAVIGVSTTTIAQVAQNTPAEAAGLLPGDQITHINGRRIFLWDDLLFEVTNGYGRPMALTVTRDNQQQVITATPAWTGTRYMLGIGQVHRAGLFSTPPDGIYRVSFGELLTEGFMRIGFVIRTIVITLVRLVTAQLGFEHLAGPIGIVNLIGEQYQATMQAAEEMQVPRSAAIRVIVINMINLSALISANLGVLNLLPLPALDGGRIVFLSLEAIRRKPISPEREGVVHFAGFVLLMILAVVIAYQDIINML